MNVVSSFTLIYISIDTVFRSIRTHQYGYIYTRSLGLMYVFARLERIDITYSCYHNTCYIVIHSIDN